LALALILLGLGWNLGLVAGTALLTDAVPLERRARTQGTVDLVCWTERSVVRTMTA
jgi:hypothetical protein